MKFCLKENHSMNHILCIHKETEFFSLIFVINRLNFSKIFTNTNYCVHVYNIFNIPSNFLLVIQYIIINRFYRSILQRINRCRMGPIENMAINRRATRLNFWLFIKKGVQRVYISLQINDASLILFTLATTSNLIATM